jgi:hypothetical protein
MEALFVKGSGWDLDAIEPPGLPAVDLTHLRKLRKLGALSDPEMVNQLRTHLFDAGAPNPSVEDVACTRSCRTSSSITRTPTFALVVTNQPPRRTRPLVREAFGPRWAVCRTSCRASRWRSSRRRSSSATTASKGWCC